MLSPKSLDECFYQQDWDSLFRDYTEKERRERLLGATLRVMRDCSGVSGDVYFKDITKACVKFDVEVDFASALLHIFRAEGVHSALDKYPVIQALFRDEKSASACLGFYFEETTDVFDAHGELWVKKYADSLTVDRVFGDLWRHQTANVE